MRRLAPLLLIALVAFAFAKTTAAGAEEAYSLGIERSITISEYALVTVDDKFNFKNNGNEPVSSLTVGFPREFADLLKHVSVKDSDGVGLRVDRDVDPSSPIYWLRLTFSKEVKPSEEYRFNSKMLFSGLVSFYDPGFTFKFAPHPTLQSRAEFSNVTIVLPADAQVTVPPNSTFIPEKVEGKPTVFNSSRPLKAFTDAIFSFNYTSTTQRMIRCEWAERQITFDPFKGISVADTYHVKNLANDAYSIRVLLPRNSTQIMLYDLLGPVWKEETASANETTVSPRYGKIKKGEVFTFTLRYNIEQKKYVKQMEWWGLYNFTMDLALHSGWIVEKFNVVITMQTGASLEWESQEPNATLKPSAFRTATVYNFTDLLPEENASVAIRYRYQSFWAAYEPLQWVFTLEIIVVALAVTFKLRKQPAPSVPIPVERIREFVELYDEKSALKLEVERMEEDMARGAITKHDYRHRRRNIDLRIDEINKALATVKTELRSIQARYDDMLRRIEKAEAEVDAGRASQTQVRTQYRTGKITREVYDTLTSDLKKRVDKARQTVDSIIITLREEAR